MPLPTYIDSYPPMTTDDISRILNHNRYYGCNTWVWNNTLNVFGSPNLDNRLLLQPKEAADIANRMLAGSPSSVMSRQEVVDSLNRFMIQGYSSWYWNQHTSLFEVPGANPPIQFSPEEAHDIAFKHKCGYLVDEKTIKRAFAPAQPLKRKPRLDRTIELVIEVDNHLINLADAASGIADKPIRAQLGVISRMMTLLKHDLRSVERQLREGK